MGVQRVTSAGNVRPIGSAPSVTRIARKLNVQPVEQAASTRRLISGPAGPAGAGASVGRSPTMTYDVSMRLIGITYQTGQTQELSYDVDGYLSQVQSIADGSTATKDLVYGPSKELLQVIDS